MARRWLSFWNQETRRTQRGGGVAHSTDADIWVPYGGGQLAVGDVVYRVAVEGGELLLFGKLTVARLDVDVEHNQSVDVWAKPGSTTWAGPEEVLSASTVDKLIFSKSDGTEVTFERGRRGGLLGNAFQGRASIRELVAGHDALDRML